MTENATRRDFLTTVAVGSASCAVGIRWFAACDAACAQPASGTATEGRKAIEAEIGRRAGGSVQQHRLEVDYYRIRRRLSYPLPVPSLSLPEVIVPSLPQYPWATWMLWALEERVNALGWAAEWLHDENAQQAATADLLALSQWPTYRQFDGPDLSSAHAGRILWTAATAWQWVSEELRNRMREACRRHVENVAAESNRLFAGVSTQADVLRRTEPHSLLHNIPLIGTIGATLTASAAQHSATASLHARVKALLGAILELRAQGFSEGVAYDGYVLDFVADWLSTLSEAERASVLDHPHFDQYLEESVMLGAPGAAERVAELSDVEPKEMPFHLSAQAKLLRWRKGPMRTWLMANCPVHWLRSDALAALRDWAHDASPVPRQPGALDAHYATVLRSGWNKDDLAVAVSCTRSPMSHIQFDNGTLVIGTQGNWLISDPGYQQYVQGEEREFTIGPMAHNVPQVHGKAQVKKEPKRIALDNPLPDVYHVAIDLAACYPAAASVKKLIRSVWLAGKDLVVVADEIEADRVGAAGTKQVAYSWHAHPACAWWFENNWALVALGRAQLWFTSPQAKVSGAGLLRLPGSRGQLSLAASLDTAPPVVWWVFAMGPPCPALHVDSDGRQLTIRERVFRV